MTANEQAAGDAANRLTQKIADARRLDAAATEAPWRCESFYDQWREVRHGHGLHNRMVVDCALGKDGEFIAHARNHHAALWDLAEAAAEHCRAVTGENGRFNVVEMDRTAKNLHAALARLASTARAGRGGVEAQDRTGGARRARGGRRWQLN